MMQKFHTIILILILQSIVYSQTGSNIWYVSTTGSGSQTGTDRGNSWSLSSMNQNLLQPGDKVYFKQGIYTSPLIPTKSGTAGNGIITWIADPTNTDSVYLRYTSATAENGILITNVKYLRFKGFNIQGMRRGVRILAGTDNIFIDSCIIRKTVYCMSITGPSTTGITPAQSGIDSIWIRWNRLLSDSLYTTGEADCISSRTFERMFIIGNFLYVRPSETVGHNDNLQAAQCVGDFIVANNVIWNNKYAHSQNAMNSASCAPYKTVFYNNIIIHTGAGASLAIVSAYNNGFEGPVTPGETYMLHNTTIINAEHRMQEIEPIIAKNNIHYNTGGGVFWVKDVFELQTNDYDYNMIYSGGQTTWAYNGAGGGSKTLQWMRDKGVSANDFMTADPRFVNFSGMDYRLQDDSPAKNFGTNIQSLIVSLGLEWKSFDNPYVPWSNPVPRGNNPTLGAWEFDNVGNGNYIEVNEGWNFISIPKLSNNMTADFLLPTRISSVFELNDGNYNEVDVLQNAKGYAVAFGYPQYIFINGQSVYSPIPVSAGWNLFGVFDEDIPVSQITTTPPGILASNFVGFEGGYETTATLKPGKGYWVKVTSNGVLNLNSGSLGKGGEVNQQIAQINQEWGKIKISDSEANSITLYVIEEDIESDVFELPPLPPKGMYDARYANGKLVEDLSNPKEILINSEKYPVIIKVEGINLQIRYRINGNFFNEELNDGEEFKITNSEISSIEVMRKITGESIDSYMLYQNYPNPFNPSTTFKYSIPNQSKVIIKVYDILGSEIETLVNEEKSNGTYEIVWNAGDQPSGVYFCTLQAGTFIETTKMVLLK